MCLAGPLASAGKMGYVRTCDLCSACVNEGPVNGISMNSVKENSFMQETNRVDSLYTHDVVFAKRGLVHTTLPAGATKTDTDSPSDAVNSALPDLVASCPKTPRSCSRDENSPRFPALNHGPVKLIGRRLRYLSDQFARRQHKAKIQDDRTQDWFTGFLRVCASAVLELWKFPT